MNRLGSLATLVGMLAGLVVLEAPVAAAAPIKFVVGTSASPGNSTLEVLEFFKKTLETKAPGSFTVEIHHSGSIGTDIQLMEAVKLGTIDMGTSSQGNFGAVSKVMLPFDLPYVIETEEDWIRLMNGSLGDEVKARVEKQDGMKMALLFPSGGLRHVMHNRNAPIRTPADAKGLKIRAVGTPINQAVFSAWGMNPTPIAWGETYNALKQGVVNGLEVPYMWGYLSRNYETIKHVTETGEGWVLYVAPMNLKKYQSLSPELRKTVDDALRETQLAAVTIDRKISGKYRDEYLKKGIKIYTPTKDEMRLWINAARKVWDQFTPDLDQEFLKRILQAAAAR